MVFYDRKVTLMEDSDQNIHLKNLSSHQASNEEEALNLLFLGDTNRMIAEVTDDDFSCIVAFLFVIDSKHLSVYLIIYVFVVS